MLIIVDGVITHGDVKNKIQPLIEKGSMTQVNGIIVHQTDGASAESAFAAYRSGQAGAHILIDKEGLIYQTARLNRVAWHVGKLKARCVSELKCQSQKWNPAATHKTESAKSWPDRFPSNNDSIGIELVGMSDRKTNIYETVTYAQNTSLKWLILQLQATLKMIASEVFRHPDVSYKQPTEAATAKW